LAACAAATQAFEALHPELRVDGQGSPAMLAVADGRAARAAGDAEAAAQLVAAGMGSMAGGVFHFTACALCSRRAVAAAGLKSTRAWQQERGRDG